MKVQICVGISGSGKSTYAEEFLKDHKNYEQWQIICRDEIRKDILKEKGIDVDQAGALWKNWKWKHEDEVTKRYWNQIDNAFKGGYNIICADTNLNKDRLNQFITKLKAVGFTDVAIKEFPITYEEATKRDLHRLHSVGNQVIYKQYQQWLDYKNELKHKWIKGLPFGIIVDMDGTLAIHTGRSPYDYTRVNEDILDDNVANVVRMFHSLGNKILITSGRDAGVCRAATEEWLVQNNVPYHELFMRSAGDNRPDTIIKKEIYFNEMHGKYNIRLALDDRPRITKLWYSLNIKCWSVADPNIEF
jgi:predicted kinase